MFYVKKLTVKQEARLISFCFRKFYIDVLYTHVHQKKRAVNMTFIIFLNFLVFL